MPAVTSKDATLTLTFQIGAGTPVDVSCQVIDSTLTFPARAEATLVPVACGDNVSEPGDPTNGALTGTVYKDLSVTGVTRFMIDALIADALLTYTWEEAEMTVTGEARVAGHDQPFTPDKFGRHPLNLTITSATPTYS